MISNSDYIKQFITNNGDNPVPYRWTHGATDFHMGDWIVVYSLIQHLIAKNCVCIGSGGGYIPRIMTQARIDLHKQGIFEGNGDYNWGDIGSTYVVDAVTVLVVIPISMTKNLFTDRTSILVSSKTLQRMRIITSSFFRTSRLISSLLTVTIPMRGLKKTLTSIQNYYLKMVLLLSTIPMRIMRTTS